MSEEDIRRVWVLTEVGKAADTVLPSTKERLLTGGAPDRKHLVMTAGLLVALVEEMDARAASKPRSKKKARKR